MDYSKVDVVVGILVRIGGFVDDGCEWEAVQDANGDVALTVKGPDGDVAAFEILVYPA